jgi:hypothetical protein
MPSYAQLEEEDAWQDEMAAPSLNVLANNIKAFYPGAGVWVRGDNSHLRGYHRSRRWIQESVYCTDHSYSVTRTSGDKSGGNSNWACAMDIALPHAELTAMCQRLDAACRAGKLEKITEWYGNLGNDNTVDGWDNISNRPASADSSHLTHLHMSFDRGRANEDHGDLFAILTGDDMAYDRNTAWMMQGYLENDDPVVVPQTDAAGSPPEFSVPNLPKQQLDRMESKLGTLSIPAPAPVDIPALVAALVPALRPEMEAAAAAAVRQVLGTLDE